MSKQETVFSTLWQSLINLGCLLLGYLSRITSLWPTFDRLYVIDLRTFRTYSIPIKKNAIQATEFLKMSPLSMFAAKEDHVGKGLVVLDPGFRNTAVRESGITHIDATRGALQYRQYPIGYLVQNHDYDEVVYLLVWGRLPTMEMKREFRIQIAKRMVPPSSVVDIIQKFDRNAPTFSMMAAGLFAWAASDPSKIPIHAGDNVYKDKPEAEDDGVYRSLAAFQTIVCIACCHQQGKPFQVQVDPTFSIIENMLVMMGKIDRNGKPDALAARTLNKIWILFADHEMTNSTAACLTATSTLADPVSAIGGALASACGPLHGGAIDLAYKRFQEFGNKEGVARHMVDVRAKKCRLMGVGHRIYRKADPRLAYLRPIIEELRSAASENPLFEVAMEIDRTVNTDPYFVSRKLNVNPDLYGSFAYIALGFDPRTITPLAMTGRVAGCIAHWKESMSQPICLWRPREIFNGTVAE